METLEQYTERMSLIEGGEPMIVGRAHQGHYRSVYAFENQIALLESRGYKTIRNNHGRPSTPAQLFNMVMSEPSDYWVSDYMIYGKNKAEKVAKHYGATLQEAPYAEEEGAWFSLCFDTFEGLMRFFYERKNRIFVDKFGNNKQKFVACEGLNQTPQDVL